MISFLTQKMILRQERILVFEKYAYSWYKINLVAADLLQPIAIQFAYPYVTLKANLYRGYVLYL